LEHPKYHIITIHNRQQTKSHSTTNWTHNHSITPHRHFGGFEEVIDNTAPASQVSERGLKQQQIIEART
jgi:extradiol dioxygenase family protein